MQAAPSGAVSVISEAVALAKGEEQASAVAMKKSVKGKRHKLPKLHVGAIHELPLRESSAIFHEFIKDRNSLFEPSSKLR
ncbi:hypothetical protein JYQ62_04645 [Nostoc sp. UHCC 0702]|nr:hypothetical protein JYQ62_04645 [Nostoc sp. UHCC 0702]